MNLSAAVYAHIEERLLLKIKRVIPVRGGSINHVYCLDTSNGKSIVKVNNKHAYPGMFQKEYNGLMQIAQTHTVSVPIPYFLGEVGDESFMILEWIESTRPDAEAMETLGIKLAGLHQCSQATFGMDEDNYMGSLPQHNSKHLTYREFYITERLQPMVKMAIDKRLLNKKDLKNFEALYQKFGALFTEEPPSLIHGDLWSGNYIIAADGHPYLIDPAISYGHREADIAMTTLFGGFNQSFYDAYNAAFPLANGWRDRVELWNLYPLLVHLNLFGLSYLGQVRDAVERYM